MTRDKPHSGLLKLRTWKRDRSAAAVLSTTREAEQLMVRIQTLNQDISRWSQQRRELQKGIVKLQQWRDNEAYRLELVNQKNSLLLELKALEVRLQTERSILLEHETQVKQVEKMMEHARVAKKAKERSIEQSCLDEWAGIHAMISRTTRP